GRGTFVSETKIQFGPRLLASFTEEMRGSGVEAGSRVLEQRVEPASEEIAGKLEIAVGSPVFLLRRLRLAGGEPRGLQTAYIPSESVPGIVDLDFGVMSLYQSLESRYRLVPDHALQKHFAIAVDGDEASLLQVPDGSPALGGERLTF